jgi:ribosomal protein S18 acetylase RimI-like enzyme
MSGATVWGFRLVDERRPWSLDGLRRASPDDVPALRAITETSHHDSWFHQDPRLPGRVCDELSRVWIERSCRGHAKAVLVAGCHGRLAGYLTCHPKDPRQGRLGLVGVAGWARGRGLGTRLVDGGVRWFAEHGIDAVRVVTRDRNGQARRLYGRSRFLFERLQPRYHLWHARAEPPGP